MPSEPRIAFGGDRDIAVWVLGYLLDQGVQPLALLLPDARAASHADQLADLCPFLGEVEKLRGSRFGEPEGLALLRRLDLDYIICVHFPHVLPQQVLSIPRIGAVNLHPAFLPYNRGWHTVSWALLEGTPIGATLHLMDQGVDAGDIIHQRRMEVSPADTADMLYGRLKQLELEVFKEAWPALASGSFQRVRQSPEEGTAHRQAELVSDDVARIDLDESVRAGDLIRRLRALTTDRIEEAAYYEVDGRHYRIQVRVQEGEHGEAPRKGGSG